MNYFETNTIDTHESRREDLPLRKIVYVIIEIWPHDRRGDRGSTDVCLALVRRVPGSKPNLTIDISVWKM